MCAATLVAQRFKLTERERADRRRRTLSQNISLLLDLKVSHAHRRCLVHQVNLVNKFQLPPFRRFHETEACVNYGETGPKKPHPRLSTFVFHHPPQHHGNVYGFACLYTLICLSFMHHWYKTYLFHRFILSINLLVDLFHELFISSNCFIDLLISSGCFIDLLKL